MHNIRLYNSIHTSQGHTFILSGEKINLISMGIRLMKVGVSAGVGVLDIATEYVDEKQLYTKPFQKITDWGRAVYTLGGYAANYMNFGDPDISETMVLSGLPLFEKSLVNATKVWLKLGKTKGRMGLKLKRPGRKVPGQTGNVRYI